MPSLEEKIRSVRDHFASRLGDLFEQSYDEVAGLDRTKMRDAVEVIAAADLALADLKGRQVTYAARNAPEDGNA